MTEYKPIEPLDPEENKDQPLTSIEAGSSALIEPVRPNEEIPAHEASSAENRIEQIGSKPVSTEISPPHPSLEPSDKPQSPSLRAVAATTASSQLIRPRQPASLSQTSPVFLSRTVPSSKS